MDFRCKHINHLDQEVDLTGNVYMLRQVPIGALCIPEEADWADLPMAIPASIYQGHLYKRRELELPLYVSGANRPELVGNINYLWEHFWVDMDPKAMERGVLTYTSWAGVERAIKGVIGKTADVSRWIVGAENSKGKAEITIPFDCGDLTFYDPTPVVVTGAFNGATPVPLTIPNAGNCVGYPTITYSGAIEDPKVVDYYGHVWELGAHMAAGSILEMVFDPAEVSITYTPSGGPAVSWYGYHTPASQLIECPSGSEVLTFTASAGTGSISVSLNARYSHHG